MPEMIHLIPEAILYTEENKFLIMYIWPSVPMGSACADSSTRDQKYSRKVQIAKHELLTCQQVLHAFTLYLALFT